MEKGEETTVEDKKTNEKSDKESEAEQSDSASYYSSTETTAKDKKTFESSDKESEAEQSGSDSASYSSTASYEYVNDPNSNVISQSQPSYSKGGKPYTPEGWIRKYKRRRSSTKKAAKKLKLE